MEKLGLYHRKCKQCGKHFECRIEYAYKRPKKTDNSTFHYFCSYKCVRAYDAENARKPTPKQQEILTLLNRGMSLKEVGETVGVNASRVGRVRDLWSVAAK